MNIVCLGCSYTVGMPPNNWYNWPEKLASLRPNDKIYNLAIGGSSLLSSCYILKEFSKILTPDKVIFQITHPHRFTSIKRIDFSSLENKDNYFKLDPSIRSTSDVMTITPGDTSLRWSKVYEKIKFAKHYYRFYSHELGNLEHEILKNVAREKSDISFTWDEVPDEAKLNTIDEAGHFDNLGHDIIGEWVNNELERNIH